MKCFARYTWLCLLSILLISGCTQAGQITRTPTIGITQAYQTVEARLTEAAITQMALPSSIPSETASPMPSIMETLAPATGTPIPAPPSSATPTATTACDIAAAGSPIDVTVPDDTVMLPGQTFTKIWRLVNVGACNWNKDYAAHFFYGNAMGAPELIYLNQMVAQGETIEIAIEMVAPETAGTHQGNWKLQNTSGALFGIGPNGNAPFWVRIVVLEPPTATPTPSSTPTTTSTSTPSPTTTTTPTATPIIQSSGAASLKPTETFDFDNGMTNPQTDEDVIYEIDTNNFHLLTPKNNAQIGIFARSEPSPAACQSAAMSQAPIPLESVSDGIYLCYRTSQGLTGWMQYIGLQDDGTLQISFRTWSAP